MGEIVEISTPEELYENPLHPYTQALLEAIPVPDPRRGGGPDLFEREEPDLPEGHLIGRQGACAFFPRCPRAQGICRSQRPSLRGLGNGRYAACLNI
jgi:oligopeptide/dipeptide ABC transporter ATP-binding protein